MTLILRDDITKLEVKITYDNENHSFLLEPPCGSDIEFSLDDMKAIVEIALPKELKPKQIARPRVWTIPLKCENPHFTELLDGRKTFDVRSKKGGRTFQPGQVLIMREYDAETDEYSGRYAAYVVSYVLDTAYLPEHYGIDAGDCLILGLRFPNDIYRVDPGNTVYEDMEGITDK